LARAPEPRVAIDLLASLGLSIAQPLLKLRAEQPGAEIPELELALDRWHFEEAYAHLKSSPRSTQVLHSALDLEADLCNLLTVLRFAHAPAERQILHERLGTPNLGHLFLGPGRLQLKALVQAGEQDSVDAAVKTLAGTPCEAALTSGLDTYMETGRLSDLERQLRRIRLGWMAGLAAKDPLGIGVPLAYFALKSNEVANLRWIAHGIHLGFKAHDIKAELEFAQ
jgi:vacuolar-type H+-ATPase subunit C/Vma6